jgi:hypothetical protein
MSALAPSGERVRRERRAGGRDGEPMFDLIELSVLRLSRFRRRRRPAAGSLQVRPRPSPGAAFRRPPARPDDRRAAGHSENHQAEPQPRAEGIARPASSRRAPGVADRRQRCCSHDRQGPASWRSSSRELQSRASPARSTRSTRRPRARAPSPFCSADRSGRATRCGCRDRLAKRERASGAMTPHERRRRRPTTRRICSSSTTTAHRALLSRFLSENGYRVTDGRQTPARRAPTLKSFAFDLIVLDVMMPGETARFLAKSHRCAPAPTCRS